MQGNDSKKINTEYFKAEKVKNKKKLEHPKLRQVTRGRLRLKKELNKRRPPPQLVMPRVRTLFRVSSPLVQQ